MVYRRYSSERSLKKLLYISARLHLAPVSALFPSGESRLVTAVASSNLPILTCNPTFTVNPPPSLQEKTRHQPKKELEKGGSGAVTVEC